MGVAFPVDGSALHPLHLHRVWAFVEHRGSTRAETVDANGGPHVSGRSVRTYPTGARQIGSGLGGLRPRVDPRGE